MKLREFQKHLQGESIDVALFFNADSNLSYFAGVRPEMACLAVPSSGESLLFVPGFEAARFSKASSVNVLQVGRDFLKDVRKEFPGDVVGIVPSAVSFGVAQKVKNEWKCEFSSVEEKCRDLRVVKTGNEILRIAQACRMTDVLFEEVCDNIKSFKTELDVSAFLKSRMCLLGVEPSFPPIVASGSNGATPHHVPSNTKLSGFVVLDFGIIYQNYCSDITRTIFVGSPSSADRRAYERLLKVQEECVKKVKPGAKFELIDAFAHKKVGTAMIHRVGHSLGIDVHDVQPRPWTLQSGNVVTIEPGVYLPGKFGIRIEDDILVGEEGPVVLTRSSKSLVDSFKYH